MPVLNNNDINRSEVRVDGVNVSFKRGGKGRDVLLIHGLATASILWQPLMCELAGSFRLTAPDLPGHGRSGSLPEEFSLSSLSNVILHFIEEAGLEQPLVIAHSFGCLPIVKPFDSIDGAGVVLVSPFIGRRSSLPWFAPLVSNERDSLFKVKISRRGIKKVMLDLLFDPGGADMELLDRALESADDDRKGKAVERMAVLLGDEPVDWKGRIAASRPPVLLVCGREDPLLDMAALQDVADGADVKLVLMERCGHFPHVERVDELARIIKEFDRL